MNYYGEDVYMTDLLIYCPEGMDENTLKKGVEETKRLFPLRAGEKTLVLTEEGSHWIGIDCDSIHQQCCDTILKQCMDIWEYPVLIYDIFDEDVLFLGYGDAKEDTWCLAATDGCLDEELPTEFPKELFPFFAGKEEEAEELWAEEVTFEEDKLRELGTLMTKSPIPEYMLGKWDVSEIPEGVKRIVL